MSLIYCHNVVLDSIFINNTGNRGGSCKLISNTKSHRHLFYMSRLMIVSYLLQLANTDGADTIRSSHITFNNWTVYNGDDSISLKANSTDIGITNSKFYNGLGIALGSIGQYKNVFETIERLTVQNISYTNTLHAVRLWDSHVLVNYGT
jgi:hypothetical protein